MTRSKTYTPMPSKKASSIGRVLSIDPGFDRIGVAIMEKEDGKEKILFSNCITTDPKGLPEARLLTIGNEIRQLIEEWRPTSVALEKLFFNANVTTALKVAEARGVILYEAARAKLPVKEYSPQDVKLAITGYGRASKPQINALIGRLVTLPPRKRLDDEIDAIALGITHLAWQKRI